MKEIAGTLSAAGMKFGIAVSRFNSLFTEQLLKGAEDCLLRHGAKPGDIAFVRVPGASELPLAVQRLLKSGKFDAVGEEVYAFSQKAGDQSYWLARAYVTLGDSFAERGQYAQAKATFESIRDGYEPGKGADDILDSVKMRLERLATLMQE